MTSSELPEDANPIEPDASLKPGSHLANDGQPQTTGQLPVAEDSVMARAEKVEWNGKEVVPLTGKRTREEDEDSTDLPPRKKGVAPIRAEYLVEKTTTLNDNRDELPRKSRDDRDKGEQKRKKQKGQNTNRTFGFSRDKIQLCTSRATSPEFSPKNCQFGDSCKFEHDLRKYLNEGKRDDLKTFEKCPVWHARGKCTVGWRCRFAMSHARERETEDGSRELVLTENISQRGDESANNDKEEEQGNGVVNIASPQTRIDLSRRRIKTPKADRYGEFLNVMVQHEKKVNNSEGRSKGSSGPINKDEKEPDTTDKSTDVSRSQQIQQDEKAAYVEPKFLPSEKRRLYFGPETPVLAPLTTQGNLPFRRLCVGLGAQVTWSEMAMSFPLIQGQKSEWALMKAHESELQSPRFTPINRSTVVEGYDNAKDIRFGAQISANKPFWALKATEIVTNICPHLRAVDLNCGCPIDLVYREGAGSALLDSPAKLEKMLRGMNAVSGEVPVQVKIRTGTSDKKATADRLIERLAFGGQEALQSGLGAPGVAAVTLHGRSRQQRYTKQADWAYIAQCASLIKGYNEKLATRTDTVHELDERQMNASKRMYFIGNGDCYSYVDYYDHIKHAKVDSVMIARGALIKPWIFEEINSGQHIDKSSSERFRYIEQFVRYGLETWGSDEVGIGTTRRFLLEWLSFACRYVPIGLLEHLPPSMNDRPPAYRGRDDLETLMASDNVKDWIKISEMFLGPAPESFRFDPKHKSNSYDTGNDYTAEG